MPNLLRQIGNPETVMTLLFPKAGAALQYDTGNRVVRQFRDRLAFSFGERWLHFYPAQRWKRNCADQAVGFKTVTRPGLKCNRTDLVRILFDPEHRRPIKNPLLELGCKRLG